jgi:hypothetical protein
VGSRGSIDERKTMRTIAILAAGASLAFTVAANAQAPSTQQPAPQPPAAAPAAPSAAPSAAPAIKKVDVVDIQELPKATQAQVNDAVAQDSGANIQSLRTSIDGMPQIKSALEAKGLASAHVIAARLGPDGTLTLVTKKPG